MNEPNNFQADPADVQKNKVFAVLAYIGLLFLVPLLGARDSKFAQYHANQGLVLFLAELITSAALNIMGRFFWPFSLISGLLWVFYLVLIILGVVNAVNGEMKPLPVIGSITLIK